MGRCPKHPEHIQSGNKCMVWVCKNKWMDNFRCGCDLEPLSSEEMGKIRAEELQETIEKTTLPLWVLSAIKELQVKLEEVQASLAVKEQEMK